MPDNRIRSHPIINIPSSKQIKIKWLNQQLIAQHNETIASALIANNIHVFGYHPRNNAPQSIFCANGQCSQCLVLADGRPVKACMTKIKPGMSILPIDGVPALKTSSINPYDSNSLDKPQIFDVPVLIIGGGPAGLSAGIELGKLGIKTLLVDDKSHLGGKLILQTHRFFGSRKAVYAGTRGTDIAKQLTTDLAYYESVTTLLDTIAVGIFEDQSIGLWSVESETYKLVQPQALLIAAGARELSLPFKGNTLPGIYGAGAFQTLVNHDLVRPANQLFILGGGNVGLIAGYHAIQAGIKVIGLAEAQSHCGGYKVHEDKLARLNVPIYTSHTILEAHGNEHVESILISKVDEDFIPVAGTEKRLSCDCVLIAIGLDPVDEFVEPAREVGLKVFVAGDAHQIAEASAAIYSGKIKGYEIAKYLGHAVSPVPDEWFRFEAVLKSKPGKVLSFEYQEHNTDVFPVMHCRQEIPCDPCADVCPKGLIQFNPENIREVPTYHDELNSCIACEKCVAICPGLAITLVNLNNDTHTSIVSIAVELINAKLKVGESVPTTDIDGKYLGSFPVVSLKSQPSLSHTKIVRIQTPRGIAPKIAGIQPHFGWSLPETYPSQYQGTDKEETIICRCEQVNDEEIRTLIRAGISDINQIKAVSKATMGACGGKTCMALIKNIFSEESIDPREITDPPYRPLFVEVPLKTIAKPRVEEER